MKLAVGFILFEDITAQYLAEFLPSLQRALSFLPATEAGVYIYDNSGSSHTLNRQAVTTWQASLDSSSWPVVYQAEGKNQGFGRAYNILISQAQADQAEYFLIINPDTKLAPESISRLLESIDQDNSLGSVAPKILRWERFKPTAIKTIDSLGLELSAGLKFFDRGQGSVDDGTLANGPILGPSGAAGLFRMSALEKVAQNNDKKQYFDERFFMYKEDCDLAYRLFLAGYKSKLVPAACIYHDRSAAVWGRGFISWLRERKAKSQQIRSWSFFSQHLIYLKYWSNQDIKSRLLIVIRFIFYFIFSLILERFLLKEYFKVWRSYRGLTNI